MNAWLSRHNECLFGIRKIGKRLSEPEMVAEYVTDEALGEAFPVRVPTQLGRTVCAYAKIVYAAYATEKTLNSLRPSPEYQTTLCEVLKAIEHQENENQKTRSNPQWTADAGSRLTPQPESIERLLTAKDRRDMFNAARDIELPGGGKFKGLVPDETRSLTFIKDWLDRQTVKRGWGQAEVYFSFQFILEDSIWESIERELTSRMTHPPKCERDYRAVTQYVWESLAREFQTPYADILLTERWKTLHRESGETLARYFARVDQVAAERKLVDEKPSDKEVKAAYRTGLPDNLRDYAFEKLNLPAEEFKRAMLAYSTDQALRQAPLKQAPAVIELDALAASLNAIISQRCDRCGFFGHDESGCNGHDLQCRNCGEVGHLQAVCKKPRKIIPGRESLRNRSFNRHASRGNGGRLNAMDAGQDPELPHENDPPRYTCSGNDGRKDDRDPNEDEDEDDDGEEDILYSTQKGLRFCNLQATENTTTTLPMVRVQLQDYNTAIQALVDTGASADFISLETCRRLNLPLNKSRQKVKLGDNSEAASSKMTRLYVRFGNSGETTLIEPIVLNTLAYHLIIGCGTLAQRGAKINFQDTSKAVHLTVIEETKPDRPLPAPQWFTPPTGRVEEVVFACEFLVVATITDNNRKFVMAEASPEYARSMRRAKVVRRMHHKWTNAPEQIRKQADDIMEEFVKSGKLVETEQEQAGATNVYPVEGKRVRPVFPFIILNKFTKPLLNSQPFQQTTIADALNKLRTAEAAEFNDIRDAFMNIKLGPNLQSVLTVFTNGKVFKFTGLPYGFCLSPLILEAVVQFLCRRVDANGADIFSYMDDLGTTGDKQAVMDGTEKLAAVFTQYELNFHASKRMNPFSGDHLVLGAQVSEDGKFISFNRRKLEEFMEFKIVAGETTYSDALSMLGKVPSSPLGPPLVHPTAVALKHLLQGVTAKEVAFNKGEWAAKISKTLVEFLLDAKREFAHLMQFKLSRRIQFENEIEIFTDSSKYCIAALWMQSGSVVHARSQVLNGRQQCIHINSKELMAVYFALNDLVQLELSVGKQFARVTIFSDNKTTLTTLKNQRVRTCTGATTQTALMRKFLNLCIELVGADRLKQFTFCAIASADNPADQFTRNPLMERILKTMGKLAEEQEDEEALTALQPERNEAEAYGSYLRFRENYGKKRKSFLLWKDTTTTIEPGQQNPRTWLEALTAKAQQDWRLSTNCDKYAKFDQEKQMIVREVRHDTDGREFQQLVIPQDAASIANCIMWLLHRVNHYGVGELTARFLEAFHFKGAKRIARQTVQSCKTCALISGKTEVAASGVKRLRAEPWRELGVDFVGPFSAATEKYYLRSADSPQFHLVTVTCLATGFADAEVTVDTTSTSLISGLRKILFRRGFPNRILSDNGKAFQSSEFREFMNHHEMDHHFIPNLHPAHAGKYERTHRILKKTLMTMLLQKSELLTSELIAKAMYAMNARSRNGTGLHSPWALCHTYAPRAPKSVIPTLVDRDNATVNLDANERASRRVEQFFKQCWPDMRESSRKAMDKRATQKSAELAEGDMVYVRKTPNSKLSVPWRGPLPIIAKKGQVVWIRLPEGMKTFHVDEVKPTAATATQIEGDMHMEDTSHGRDAPASESSPHVEGGGHVLEANYESQ